MGGGKGVYVPGEVLLGASPKGTQPFALVYEPLQGLTASRDGVVAAVDNSPLGRFVPVVVPSHAQGPLDPPQGARLRDGLRPTLNLPFLVCSQKCVMPRKSNVLPTLPAVRSGKPTELDDFPGAVQVGQPLPKVPEKALRIAQMLKAAHEVVRIMIVSPPAIRLRQWFWNQSHVVQVNVREAGRYNRPLRCSLASRSLP